MESGESEMADSANGADKMDAETVANVERDLNRYVEMGFLTFYVPTIPAGEEFVVGLPTYSGMPPASGGLVKLSPDQVISFLIGATMVVNGMAHRQGLLR